VSANIFRIAWIAVRELVYEKVFYLLLIFAMFALGLSLLLGQLTYAEQTKLTLDFMFAGIELSMVLFCVFMGIFLFKRELTLGSVSMVLSKPISRTTFLLGKCLGQSIVQLIVIFVMTLIAMLVSSRSGSVVYLSIIQTTLLIFFEVSVLTAITYFFAVNSGAVITAIGTLSLFCLGHFRVHVSENLKTFSFENAFWGFLKRILPDFEIFNMKALASYGFTLSWVEVGWAFVYAVCCIVFFLVMAALIFQRKDVLT